jgi:hypothetical protein
MKLGENWKLCICCTACVWLAADSKAGAQSVRYEPSRPTVSPYLNLFREQTGVIPNYQSLVRPFQRQIEINEQQRQIDAQRGAAISRLQAELYELQLEQASKATVAPTGKSGWFLQPGQRQRFLSTSSYFSRSGIAVRGR